jgi:hypothetical protein
MVPGPNQSIKYLQGKSVPGGWDYALSNILSLHKSNPKGIDALIIGHLMDWGEIIRVYQIRQQHEMNIILIKVVCYDWTRYEEDVISKEKITLKETKGDVSTNMVLQDFITNPGFNVKNLIAKQSYFSDKKKWKPEYELKW